MGEILYARSVVEGGRLKTLAITRENGETTSVAGDVRGTHYVSERGEKSTVIRLADRADWKARRESKSGRDVRPTRAPRGAA